MPSNFECTNPNQQPQPQTTTPTNPPPKVVYDAELPSDSLHALSAATKLTMLQIGLTDVADLRPLQRLPLLQVRRLWGALRLMMVMPLLACCQCSSTAIKPNPNQCTRTRHCQTKVHNPSTKPHQPQPHRSQPHPSSTTSKPTNLNTPQDLYLDTCALEDVRQLPVAAAAAGLPLSGSRALTGLYCVDQLFPS